jgi:hypothetical protein
MAFKGAPLQLICRMFKRLAVELQTPSKPLSKVEVPALIAGKLYSTSATHFVLGYKELQASCKVVAARLMMERDPFESAIDKILAEADGDVRLALRAVLRENVQLEAELRHLYAAAEHGSRNAKALLH